MNSKGTRNERRSRAVLEAAGYRVVKSGASLGEFDLVCIGPVDLIGVQVKSNRLPSPAERESMKLFPAPANFRRLVHVWYDRARLPRVEEL